MTVEDVRTIYLRDISRTFRNYKTLGEKALSQVSDADLNVLIDPESNSLAIIVKHIGGSLRSRFTDFLTTDGEKPTRNRDGEFEAGGSVSREQVLEWWESGWSVALATIGALTQDDIDRTVHIRREAFVVVEALNRAAAHVAYHVGQIVFIAKHLNGPQWHSLSIPKNRSAEATTGTFKQGIVPER